MDEMTLTLHNPLTEEEWDIIEDVDFDHTNSITFHTKHGKEVEFVKRKTGRWIQTHRGEKGFSRTGFRCDQCGEVNPRSNYCPSCGARMEGET